MVCRATAYLHYYTCDYGRFYPVAPADFPIHFDMSGAVTDTVAKSPRVVLLLPMMQLGMIALFIFINFVIARSKQSVENENPTDSLKGDSYLDRFLVKQC